MEPLKRFPLNAPGDFFVEDSMCMGCQAPENEAPELIEHAESEEYAYHCYFRRQPETTEEVEHAIRAAYVSCIRAVQNGGNDPKILARLDRLRKPGWHKPEA